MYTLAANESWLRLLRMEDHTTRVVVLGTTMLGAAAGLIGTFAYLRRRAMLGDALSHATLPGIAAAFILLQQKNLAWLLVGAAISGTLGLLAVMALRMMPRIKEDAAIGIVLSVGFGMGMVLLSIIQKMNTGEEAGLNHFIYGKAASMNLQDARFIAWAAAITLLATVLLYKEFRILCFDAAYTASLGWPVLALDLLMMSLVIVVTVVGLQAVGLIMVVALLIVPAASARFWTDRFLVMLCLAGLFGAMSGYVGSNISALAPRLPTGAIIVLVAGAIFAASMIASPHRGVIAQAVRRWRLSRRVGRQHLLRALAEIDEQQGGPSSATFETVLRMRSWSASELKRLVRMLVRDRHLKDAPSSQLQLTSAGRIEAQRVLRNHRLWELFLIRYADIAPSHVDRDADAVEHVLTEPVIRELEQALAATEAIPQSPHPLEVAR